MTTLARPVADPAGGEAGSSDHAACGRRMTQGVLRTTVDPAAFTVPDNAWAAGHWNGLLWVPGIADSVEAFGHGWHGRAVWPADVVAELISAIAQDQYLGVSMYCDANANPVPPPSPRSHWVAAFSDAGDVFNCWEQTYPRYAQLRSVYDSRVGCVRIWRDPAPPSPPPPGTLVLASVGDESMVQNCTRPDGSGIVDTVHLTADNVARHTSKDATGVLRYGPDPLPGRYNSIDWWGWYNGKLTFHGVAVDTLGNSGYFATEKTGDSWGGWLRPAVRQGGSGPPAP